MLAANTCSGGRRAVGPGTRGREAVGSQGPRLSPLHPSSSAAGDDSSLGPPVGEMGSEARKTRLVNLVLSRYHQPHLKRGSRNSFCVHRLTLFTLGGGGSLRMRFSRNSLHRCAQRGGGCGYSLLMTLLARIIMMITITIVVISGSEARAAGGGRAGGSGCRATLQARCGRLGLCFARG